MAAKLVNLFIKNHCSLLFFFDFGLFCGQGLVMKRIVFAVTNDLNFDQRMIRICHSLQSAGYEVTLLGRSTPQSQALTDRNFRQKRIPLFFQKGKLFYLEYNFRLFFQLLFTKTDLIGAIDLDTIIPCYWASLLKGCHRVHDAHELFCEMQEIISRPGIYRLWKWVEKKHLPRFPLGYTVNTYIQQEFKKMYGLNYAIIRNAAVLRNIQTSSPASPFIIYQGAVNEGRCFETLIPAMKSVDLPLYICGTGNFMNQAVELVKKNKLDNKVIFKGALLPEELSTLTPQATLGLTLFVPEAANTYYSLANRFFDYMQSEIPQVCVDYPLYREINDDCPIALLTNDLTPEGLAQTINELIRNKELHSLLKENCKIARARHCWQEEEKKLIAFYKQHYN